MRSLLDTVIKSLPQVCSEIDLYSIDLFVLHCCIDVCKRNDRLIFNRHNLLILGFLMKYNSKLSHNNQSKLDVYSMC